MRQLLSSREFRFLGSGLAAAVALSGALVGFWASPWSPGALDRPALMVASGDASGAAASFERLARGWGPESTREEAFWRLTLLTTVELDQPQRGAELLREYMEIWPASVHEAEALARLGVLYSQRMDDPVRAAESWQAAAAAAPDSPEAGRWLLQAGRALARAEQPDLAEPVLLAATAYPGAAPAAWLALGHIHLTEDPATAYEQFDAALRAAGNGPEGRLARLGLATALERLERRDAALAEVDEALAEGDPDPALERRQQRLRQAR